MVKFRANKLARYIVFFIVFLLLNIVRFSISKGLAANDLSLVNDNTDSSVRVNDDINALNKKVNMGAFAGNYAFKIVDNNYINVLKLLLGYNLSVYERAYESFSNVSMEKQQFYRDVTGNLVFRSKLLSPVERKNVKDGKMKKDVEFFSAFEYRVNLLRFGASVFQYLNFKPLFLSSFHEFVNFVGNQSIDVMEQYYSYFALNTSISSLKKSTQLYDKIYKEALYKEKHGLDEKESLIRLKSAMIDSKLRMKQDQAKIGNLKFKLYNLIGNHDLSSITKSNMGKLMFSNLKEFQEFVMNHDHELWFLRYKCQVLSNKNIIQKIDRFAPLVNLNMQWLFTGNFGDKDNLKTIYKNKMLNYRYDYNNTDDDRERENTSFGFDFTLDWNISNILFGSPNKQNFAMKHQIMKKRLILYKAQLKAKVKQLYDRYFEELEALKFIDKNLADMRALKDRNVKAYQLGVIELKTLYDTLVAFDRLQDQRIQQQNMVYLHSTMINKYAIYYVPALRMEINKYCLAF